MDRFGVGRKIEVPSAAHLCVGCGCIPSEKRIAQVSTFIGTIVDVCAANGDDPLRAAIKSKPKMDNASLTIVVSAIFAWLD